MRIGIDARMYGNISRGIGRYLEELIRELEKIDQENDYYIFLYDKNFDDYQPQNPRFHKVLAPWHWYTLAEQWHMPRLLKKYKLDLVHFPHFNVPYFYKGDYVITIHDLILWFDSQKPATTLGPLLYNLKKFAYKILLKKVLKKARQIMVPSLYTKEDILKINTKISEKIALTYEGVNREKFQKEINDKDLKIRYNIRNPYCFYVGSYYPHKRIDFLIENWSAVFEKYNYQLLLLGKKDSFQEKLVKQVAQLGLEDKVLFLGFVSDEDLATFYQNAEAFLFPSRYEGFGLPPLEALAKHCPVLSSKRSCLPEVLEDKAIYFEYNQESFLNAMAQLEGAREKLENIEPWLQKYSWRKMAEETLNIYGNK